MATLPEGNRELLVVRDKAGRPPGELRVRKSMECDISLQRSVNNFASYHADRQTDRQ